MDTVKILKEEVQNPPTIYYIETTDNPIEASFLQRNNKVPRSYTILSYIYLGHFVCLCVCHNCGTLIYSFSFSNQTDQGAETEGLEREWRDRKGTDRRGRV